MCFGKKSSNPAPAAPQVVMPNPANVADTSNNPQQKQAAIDAAGPSPMSSFGSELGGSSTMSGGVS